MLHPLRARAVKCLKLVYGGVDCTTTTGGSVQTIARSKSYRVHVSKPPRSCHAKGVVGRTTVSYWCFEPSLAMRDLASLRPRSIIITSGTLSPLSSLSMELGLQFPVMLENDHVISGDQIFVRVVGRGVSGKALSSKFGRRDDPEYISELGNTLASLCRNIPGGILIFFPSYASMEKNIQRWGGPAPPDRVPVRVGVASVLSSQEKKRIIRPKHVFHMVPGHFRPVGGESSPWQRLLAWKPIVVEPRSSSDLTDVISEYKKMIAAPNGPGAILMGVCRGKISEGVSARATTSVSSMALCGGFRADLVFSICLHFAYVSFIPKHMVLPLTPSPLLVTSFAVSRTRLISAMKCAALLW